MLLHCKDAKFIIRYVKKFKTNQPFIWQSLDYLIYSVMMGFPDSLVGKESACSAGDPDSFPGLEDPLDKW